MAMLNARCLAVKSSLSPKLPTFPSSKPISLKKQEATPAAVAAAAGAVFSALSAAEPAMAAQQLAELAEGSDNRGLALLIPLVPAVLWVLYNILQPALNQLNRMRSEKALVAGLGVGAAMAAAGLLAPPGAVAAAAADAAGDNRGLALLIPLVPAVLWVLYNILQPALNQINRMRSG